MSEEMMDMNIEENDAAEKEIAGESKADKFKRLGTARVNKVLVAISRLEGLSSSAYEYTDEQVEAMFGAIYTKLDKTKAMFSKTKKETETFSF